jgi:hypothetical protein
LHDDEKEVGVDVTLFGVCGEGGREGGEDVREGM